MSGRGQRVSRGHPADLLQDLCCQQPARVPGERLLAALAAAGDAPAHQRPLSPRWMPTHPFCCGPACPDPALFGPPIPRLAPSLLAACSCPENPFPAFEIEDARAICVLYFLVETNKPRIASSP